MVPSTTQARKSGGKVKDDNSKGNTFPSKHPEITQRKLSPLFVDDVSNISIAPNGACRLYFTTWSTGDDNNPVQVQSEIIMTIQSLKILAEGLPKAIEQAVRAEQEMA
ncbi:MAG: hypothetical protein ACN4GR_07845 [Arenicellales bacterium]